MSNPCWQVISRTWRLCHFCSKVSWNATVFWNPYECCSAARSVKRTFFFRVHIAIRLCCICVIHLTLTHTDVIVGLFINSSICVRVVFVLFFSCERLSRLAYPRGLGTTIIICVCRLIVLLMSSFGYLTTVRGNILWRLRLCYLKDSY